MPKTSGATRLIFTYYCIDGCVRTRCAAHVEHAGPYAIAAGKSILRREHTTPTRTCIICCHLAAASPPPLPP